MRLKNSVGKTKDTEREEEEETNESIGDRQTDRQKKQKIVNTKHYFIFRTSSIIMPLDNATRSRPHHVCTVFVFAYLLEIRPFNETLSSTGCYCTGGSASY